jgi:hypothetical protein
LFFPFGFPLTQSLLWLQYAQSTKPKDHLKNGNTLLRSVSIIFAVSLVGYLFSYCLIEGDTQPLKSVVVMTPTDEETGVGSGSGSPAMDKANR